jgi:hypothetical protein
LVNYLPIYLFKIFGMRWFTPSETVGYATLCAPVILVTVPNYSERVCVTLTQQHWSKP